MFKKVFLFLLILGLAGAGFAYHHYTTFLKTPLVFTTPTKTFNFERGWSAKRLSHELVDLDILKEPWMFNLYLRLSKQSGSLQAGEYSIASGMTPSELTAQFTQGDVTYYKFTIIEGWSYQQLRLALSEAPDLLHNLSELTDEQIMNELGLKGVHPEGQFLPDTYHFPKNTDSLSFLKMANKALHKTLEKAWQARAKDLPLTSAYEALTLASIIEKETAATEERVVISGVFNRRLAINMRLQTDPTVIYGMGNRFKGNIRKRDLTTDTPYNTYTRNGLPPTPIALASADAIQAVLNPAKTSALYFVSKGNGQHIFSNTLTEHNKAVRHYILNQN